MVFLQEIGKLLDKFVFHPLYAAYYTRVATGSSRVAILLRRAPQLRLLEEHYSPYHRALILQLLYMEHCIPLCNVYFILQLLYMEHCIQSCNVYFKSGAESHEILLTMVWTHPFLQILAFFQIFGGDFNDNGGWDLIFPLASSAVSAYVLDSFENMSIRVVPKVNPGPTGISPQGYFGSPDNFLISPLDQQSAGVTTHTESVFPSHHFPICLQLRNIQAMEAPVAIHTRGWIPAPRVIPSQYVQKYQALFSDLSKAQAPDTLDAYYRHFSNMVVQAAISTFGEPLDSTSTPTLVTSVQHCITTILRAHPDWWWQHGTLKTYN